MGASCCCCCCHNTDTITPTPENKLPTSTDRHLRREYSAKPSFTNIGISTSNPLKLIDGYLDEPLVSLEEALQPFDGKIDQLSHYIKEAKRKCHYPSEPNLTRDESAGIYIYTMHWGEGCLYNHLEDAWKSENRSKLKPWLKYLKLFRTALDKLPNAKTEIWQGTSFDEKVKELLSSNSLSFYSSMDSCLQSEKEVKEYLEKHGTGMMIRAGYESINGKVVIGYTANSWKEVIVWPGMKLGVTKYEMTTDGTLIVHLKPKPKNLPKSNVSTVLSSDKHFVCPYKGCGNRCPADHKGDHCHTFAILFHTCHHHCSPCNKCEKCDKLIPNLCKCYKCGSAYCVKCCFK